MDIENFSKIITKPESQILDFKEKYDFSGNNKAEKRKKQEKFVVDIVSFSNTIRFEPAYIILGIKDNKQLVGIDADYKYRNDAKFQQIVGNFQVDPFPYFIYDEITYENMVFGIIEFPMPKNNRIISLHKDGGTSFYGRRGSSNSKLEEHEIYDINQWLNKIETINFSKLSGIIENSKINTLINQQNIREAQEELEIQKKSLNSQMAECEYLDALLNEIQGDNENAKRAYLRALDLDSSNPIYLKELSLIYYELNEYTNAINTFKQLLQIFDYNIGRIDTFLQEEAVKSTSKINKAKIDADIGALLFIQGHKNESKDRLKMSYDILRVEYGDGHPKTKNVRFALEMVELLPANIFRDFLGIE